MDMGIEDGEIKDVAEAVDILQNATRNIVAAMEGAIAVAAEAEGTPGWSRVTAKKPAAHALVLDHVRARGALGATDDEIEIATGLSHQNASARRRELVLRGALKPSGLRRRTRTGRTAAVWVEGTGHPSTKTSPTFRRPWATALEEAAELIASAAPVTWTAGSSDEAHEWEKRAVLVLARIEDALGKKKHR
jgi:hypothetical protein